MKKILIGLGILSALSLHAATDLRVINNSVSNIIVTAHYVDSSQASFEILSGEANLRGDDVSYWVVDGCAGNSSGLGASRVVAVVGMVNTGGGDVVGGRWYAETPPTVFVGYGAGVGAVAGCWLLLVSWLRRLPSGLADVVN